HEFPVTPTANSDLILAVIWSLYLSTEFLGGTLGNLGRPLASRGIAPDPGAPSHAHQRQTIRIRWRSSSYSVRSGGRRSSIVAMEMALPFASEVCRSAIFSARRPSLFISGIIRRVSDNGISN